MKRAKFYKTVLVEVKGNVLDEVYPHCVGTPHMPTMEERMGTDKASCPECIKEDYISEEEKNNPKWIMLPEEGSAVREGGKAYIECMHCGCTTHL